MAGAFAAGTGSVSATEPSPEPSSQRPSRPIATVTTSYSAGSSDSSTERAEASEISCSDDRPPARIATFSRLTLTAEPGVAVNLPTAIVTIVPGACCDPPDGSWVCTMPSWLWSVTGWLTIFTPKPEAFSVAWASFWESVVTSGRWRSSGPSTP